MRKYYKAFTLVEMLIVMGIIIILMAVGIASGRFAIRRANKIEHQNAAEQIYQALQSYYSDNREYPAQEPPETLLTTTLDGYIDDFDGGSDATYYYETETTGQIALVCVTYGGLDDINQLGAYCTGNGIGTVDELDINIEEKDMDYADSGTDYNEFVGNIDKTVGTGNASDWTASDEWD
jgi:type II secretory pathway pseudopilin PulG